MSNFTTAMPSVHNIIHHGAYEGSLYESIAGVNSSDWDSCVADSALFLTRKYLKTCEESSLPGLQFRYLTMKLDGVPKAIAYFQLVNLSDAGLGGILNLEEYGGLAGSLSGRINNILFDPDSGRSSFLLVCGNLLISGNHGIAAVDENSFQAVAGAIVQVKKAIERSLPSNSRIVGYMVKDFYEAENLLAAPILKKDYFCLNTDPEMIVDIRPEWTTFEDYLEALSSKYRIRAKNALTKLGPVVIRELSDDEVRSNIGRLYELNDNVIRKAPVKLVRPSAPYFLNLKEQYGPNFRVKGFFLENEMVAFTSAVWSPLHMEAHCIGLDYSLNLQYSLYLNILYTYIKDAIDCKSSRLFFGRTALEIKSTTGARPYDLGCYFRFANRILNSLARPLVSSTGPGQWIPRDPFKR